MFCKQVFAFWPHQRRNSLPDAPGTGKQQCCRANRKGTWLDKKGNEKDYKLYLGITLILGLLFVVLQYKGWLTLTGYGIEIKGNPSGSFFYVLSGLHVAHVLGGIAALITALIHAFVQPYKVTEQRRHRFELVCQYWHFVDILWIYLLSFMIIQQ